MGAGILPLAQDARGQWRYLLGREAADGRWAPFGGLRERGETLLATALREGYEETMGLLGSAAELARLPRIELAFARDARPVASVAAPAAHSLTALLLVPWDAQLPLAFDRFYRYAADAQGRPRPRGREGFWEKDRVAWFSRAELQRLAAARQLRPYFSAKLPHITAVLQTVGLTQ